MNGCYLINVGYFANNHNLLKGFQKEKNKSNKTITVVSYSEVKCIFIWVLFSISSQFSSIITIIEFVVGIKFIKLCYPLLKLDRYPGSRS